MNDLESQRRALRQEWPERSVSGGGQIPNLTPEQRECAKYNDSIAEDLMRELSAHKRYFTAYSLKQKPIALEPLVELGIITKHKSTEHDGNYYKPTHLTRSWVLTSLALRDERIAAMQKRTDRG